MKTTESIREELKAAGYNSRQVSVKEEPCKYDTSIKVKIKDVTIPIRCVEDIVKKYEKIDRCQYSGEILCGCNTFVLVSYDWKAQEAALREFIPKAEEVMREMSDLAEGDSRQISEGCYSKFWYMRGRDGDRDRVCLFDKNGYSRGGMDVPNTEYLARAIMKVELYGTLR